MLSGEQLLEQAAKDGSMVPDEWPRALEVVLSRLEHIVQNEFPTPTVPPPPPAAARDRSTTPSKQPENLGVLSQESHSANKENAPPAGGAAAASSTAATAGTPSPGPSAQALSSSDSQQGETADGEPQQQQAPGQERESSSGAGSGLPAELRALHASIAATLAKDFPKHPPHTVQRLAELVVSPRAHYRFLPPYLRALDRVVSVSSTTTVFPLPQAAAPATVGPGGILNGITPSGASSGAAASAAAAAAASSTAASQLGSDESLGGALLTPIPWLRTDREGGQRNGSNNGNNSELVSESTEMVEGPNGAGRIETVSVVNGVLTTSTTSPTNNGSSTASGSAPEPQLREAGGITQGELLRQEQEAGVVPVGQSTTRRALLPSSPSGAGAGGANTGDESKGPDVKDEEEEAPHARGPEEIGMEDTGPQDSHGPGLNLEAAVGRPSPSVKTEEESKEKKEEPSVTSPEAEMKDAGAEEEEEAKKEKDEEKKTTEGDEKEDDEEKEASGGGDAAAKPDTEMAD